MKIIYTKSFPPGDFLAITLFGLVFSKRELTGEEQNHEADRVYIIQPHPLSDKQFISVSLEVLNPDRDVRPQKDNFQYKKISEWAGFISKLSTEDWLVYKDPEHIKDLKFRLEFKRRGLSSFVSRRMTDEGGQLGRNLMRGIYPYYT